MEFILNMKKDIGLRRTVMDVLPYAVVGNAWNASFQNPKDTFTALNHIIPHGRQLKVLFLRVWSEETTGAKYSIVQTNPTAVGQTGTTEAYPVVGSVPSGARDYPMLEAPGAEVIHGSLEDPIHVLEGSIEFRVLNTPTPATGKKYGIVWWGVESAGEDE